MNARHIAIAIIALVCLLGSSHLQAANPPDKSGAKGYRFVLTIKNNHDSIMYLGNYYAGKTYAIDTARIDKKGRFVFERKNMTLFPGMYFFTNPAGNYVEFMVHNEKPDFTFATAGFYVLNQDKSAQVKLPASYDNPKGYAPFALCFPAEWQWPTEKTALNKSYTKFSTFALLRQGGDDWYSTPVEGLVVALDQQ